MLSINIIIIITVIFLFISVHLLLLISAYIFVSKKKNPLTFFSLSHTKIPVSRSFDKKELSEL